MAIIYTAKPHSARDIEILAVQIRSLFCSPPYCKYADILDILKNKISKKFSGFIFEIVDDNLLDGEEARTTFNPLKIQVTQRIHDAAESGNARARFTLAHELGHLLLHSKNTNREFARMPYASDYDNHDSKIVSFRNAEWQANKFAACFLMPTDLLRDYNTIEDIKHDFGVSHAAANNRFEEVNRGKGQTIKPDLQKQIDKLKLDIKNIR